MSCVLLGVGEESKAYKLYDPTSQRIIISRDVVFEEDKNSDWDKKYEKPLCAIWNGVIVRRKQLSLMRMKRGVNLILMLI